MNLLQTILRQLHLIDPFDHDEIEKASAENALHDHNVTMRRLDAADRNIGEAQGKLRDSIEYSRTSSVRQSDPIAQLVHDMRSSGQPHRN
ncbi:hypothetical protein [Bradyrhizobium erythrophlei]|uniref:Uncharacterized protein n=1 Tax=Bradyrhizobium erythrophlei TaxID=1437360 RepID=A0A1H4NYJ1_9BRAD|nr:hypothetical protein [Bradyrhizobium erythrophlei]SEC00233.1 hypothetical protein SAMN05444164_0769 [Bradyrhizobium erythrophlei]